MHLEEIAVSIPSCFFVEAVVLYSERQLIQKIHEIYRKILVTIIFAIDFLENIGNFFTTVNSKNSEVAAHRYFTKRLLRKLDCNFIKKDFDVGILLWVLQIFKKFFHRITSGDCL